MKKFLRGLYLAVCYILGLPILFVMLAVMIIVTVIKDIIDGSGFELSYVKDLILAAFDGLKMGHWRNMQFVKYGNNYDKWFSEELK